MVEAADMEQRHLCLSGEGQSRRQGGDARERGHSHPSPGALHPWAFLCVSVAVHSELLVQVPVLPGRPQGCRLRIRQETKLDVA